MSERLRLLVIEDVESDFKLLERHLRRALPEARCTWVAKPEELQAALAQGGWHAVLADYNMPGMPFEPCRTVVRAQLPDAPIILVSGSVGEDRAVELLRQGVADFVLKDNLARLAPAIERSLQEAREQRARYAAERALVESREQYRRLVEELREEYIFYRRDASARFSYVSPSVENILGYSPDEVQRRLEEILTDHPGNVLARQRLAADRHGAAQQSIELEVRHADGGRRWLEVLESPVRDAAGRLVAFEGIAHDVTGRKQAAQALQESEERLSLALSAASMGVWEWDTRTDALYWSPECYPIMGVEHFSGRLNDFLARVHPADRRRVRVVAVRAMRWRARYQLEYRIVRPSGDVRWVACTGRVRSDASGRPARLVGTIQDVTEQRRAEERIRQLSRAVEQSPASVVITDLHGNIEYVNPRFCQVTGYSEDEVLGQNPRLLKSGEMPASVYQELWQTITRGGEWRGELHNRRKSGELYWESASISPILDETGRTTHYLGVKEDITERKREEDEREVTLRLLRILNSETDLRGLLEAAVDLLREAFDCQVVGIRLRGGMVHEPDGSALERIADLCVPAPENHQATTLECLCSHLLRGERPLAGADYTARGSLWTGHLSALAGEAAEFESVAVVVFRIGETPYGVLQLADRRQGRLSRERVALLEHLAEALTTASAHRQAAQQVQQSERRYRQLFECSHDAVFVVADPRGGRGRFVDANEVACRRLGYTREELLQLTPLDISTALQSPTGLRAVDALIDQGGGVIASTHITKDGQQIPVEVSLSLLELEGQTVALVVARDMTERVRAEQERRELESQLLHAQRMEAVGRLAGGIAHDVNNMLSVILGYAELASADVTPGDPVAHAIDEIANAGRRSADLTRQLLAFSRQQVIAPRPIDLAADLKSMGRLLQRIIGEDVELSIECAPDLWTILLDPSQADQVLANLAVNARDAMPNGGRLIIRADNVVVDEALCRRHHGATAGEYVLLSVRDTGCGMDSETMQHIFEPFFTTKEEGRGTGLGLSTVYGIVRQNGGFIDVESAPGAGTTMRLYLPRYLGQALPQAPSVEGRAAEPCDETILLVEDNRQVRGLAATMLRRLGYTVVEAGGPDEALGLVEGHDKPFDLLLTDLVMPGKSGSELAEILRGRYPGLRVLYITGYPARSGGGPTPSLGGVPVVQKPFTQETLAKQVRAALDAGQAPA